MILSVRCRRLDTPLRSFLLICRATHTGVSGRARLRGVSPSLFMMSMSAPLDRNSLESRWLDPKERRHLFLNPGPSEVFQLLILLLNSICTLHLASFSYFSIWDSLLLDENSEIKPPTGELRAASEGSRRVTWHIPGSPPWRRCAAGCRHACWPSWGSSQRWAPVQRCPRCPRTPPSGDTRWAPEETDGHQFMCRWNWEPANEQTDGKLTRAEITLMNSSITTNKPAVLL